MQPSSATSNSDGDKPGSGDTNDTAPTVENPTGKCQAEGDGSRVEHSPNPTDVYLPDCSAPLDREYYRVFVEESGTAYTIPRMSADPAFYRACLNEEDPLHEVLQTYSLCDSSAPSTPDMVEKLNSMAPADALALTHYLHERLVFFVTEQGVSPYPMAQDILDACKADEQFRNGAMQERCDFEIAAEQQGVRTTQGWIHVGEQAEALAAAMNELYGLSGDELCERLSQDASLTLTRTIGDISRPCTSDTDCVGVAHASACHDACTSAILASSQSQFDSVVEQLASEQCATRTAADCGPAISPPCDAPGEPACVEGQCSR
jgi:hypothetical protein